MAGPVEVRQIEKALADKGMARREGSHHVMFIKEYPGGPTLVTRLSRGVKEYPDSLLAAVGNQLALDQREVHELVSCTLDERGWDEIVRSRCPDGLNPRAPFRRGHSPS